MSKRSKQDVLLQDLESQILLRQVIREQIVTLSEIKGKIRPIDPKQKPGFEQLDVNPKTFDAKKLAMILGFPTSKIDSITKKAEQGSKRSPDDNALYADLLIKAIESPKVLSQVMAIFKKVKPF